MAAWILFIFLANGDVKAVPHFADFAACLEAQQAINTQSETLYPPEKQVHALCLPASTRSR